MIRRPRDIKWNKTHGWRCFHKFTPRIALITDHISSGMHGVRPRSKKMLNKTEQQQMLMRRLPFAYTSLRSEQEWVIMSTHMNSPNGTSPTKPLPSNARHAGMLLPAERTNVYPLIVCQNTPAPRSLLRISATRTNCHRPRSTYCNHAFRLRL